MVIIHNELEKLARKTLLFQETFPKYTLDDISWVDPMWNRS